ncbi:MAG: PBP1A family penicillin-binding protein [Deltaproteobacteria bacterium]|nr:PBP1A family penicillin-binding protein [Deltaproteobacteria bacterium]
MTTRLKRVVLIAAAALVVVLGSLVAAYLYLNVEIPAIHTLADYKPPQATHVYSDDGALVAVLARERRTVVPIEALPPHVTHAFLAAEDERFYEHEGLDYLGILRAAVKNLRPGAHLQGASTITQQTVKALLVGAERTYARKMREAILARELEATLTKDGILHLYLNQIYFGSGAYGVEAAARIYFDKSARELDLGEAALLAAIPKNPSRYTIRANPAAAKERQTYVLHNMLANDWATKEEVEREIAKPVPAPPAASPYFNHTPHYVEQVRRLLLEKYGEDAVYESGMTVYTGMDAKAQLAATDAVRQGLEDLARKQGYAGARLRVEVDRFERFRTAMHQALDTATKNAKAEIDQKLDHKGTSAPEHDGEPPVAKVQSPLYDEVQNAVALASITGRHLTYVWDLARFTAASLNDEAAAVRALSIVPLAEGRRVTAIVTKVNAVDGSVVVDLGTATGKMTLASLDWARRFSPTADTPAPRVPGEVLAQGDLVAVDIVAVPVRLASDKSELTLKVELVPEPRAEGALVAIDPHSRHVRALVGGYEQTMGGLIRAVQSKRQPGSAFKPVVYATGLDQALVTQASLCPDTPIVIRDPWTGKAWKPENYEDGKYDGNITYRTALLRSKNTCSVKLIEKLGPEKVIAMAHALGITSTLPENLTLALGSGDVTPLELANSYATIAAGGYFAPPIFIRKVVSADGRILEEAKSEPVEVLRPAVAYVLADMMRSVVEEGTATKALVLDRPLAGKTGTSNESRNVWFGGFSAELVAVVWVGFDDNASLGKATGGGTALPVWIRFMGRALDGVPRRDFQPPADVVFVRIDPDTGRLSRDIGNIEAAFLAGTEPNESKERLPSVYEIENDNEGPRLAKP